MVTHSCVMNKREADRHHIPSGEYQDDTERQEASNRLCSADDESVAYCSRVSSAFRGTWCPITDSIDIAYN